MPISPGVDEGEPSGVVREILLQYVSYGVGRRAGNRQLSRGVE